MANPFQPSLTGMANDPYYTAPQYGTKQNPPKNMGMPLDPMFEQQRRGLDDSLSASLAGISSQRSMIDPRMQQDLARMGTDQSWNTGLMNESEVGRGMYDSSIRGMDATNLNTQYDRMRQDLANQSAEQYSLLAQDEGNAYLGYNQGLMELLLQSAEGSASDPYSPMPTYGGPGGGYEPGGKRDDRNGNGRNGNGRNGNGRNGNGNHNGRR